jgi:hypothetical protein
VDGCRLGDLFGFGFCFLCCVVGIPPLCRLNLCVESVCECYVFSLGCRVVGWFYVLFSGSFKVTFEFFHEFL